MTLYRMLLKHLTIIHTQNGPPFLNNIGQETSTTIVEHRTVDALDLKPNLYADVDKANCCCSIITLSSILLIILLMAMLRYILESVTFALAPLGIGIMFVCRKVLGA